MSKSNTSFCDEKINQNSCNYYYFYFGESYQYEKFFFGEYQYEKLKRGKKYFVFKY